ncbi:dual specificity protein phosphatase-like protein [Shimia isoporae]|uniref:Dual specificity protein phosphatase-like protein n=1 Tax=Shimia isoporae TaxID=647720 RepID=A0A4R1NKA8_9RHOB|nr:dual specificity protein phosphatase family protein [Shimia isoporae]TCL08059.1 dual specificity protein phosphatase-like protein [Shimia isoporae]
MSFEIVEWRIGPGIVALSPMPVSLEDFDRVAAWAPSAVVSVTSEAEMAAKGTGIQGRLQSGQWTWHHAPIVDFGVPSAEFMNNWPALSAELLGQLEKGGRVLVHCKGGCGRSGMLVLALMVLSGKNATTALSNIRATRPCAVETNDQFQWASNV